jgi:hypothetical protein
MQRKCPAKASTIQGENRAEHQPGDAGMIPSKLHVNDELRIKTNSGGEAEGVNVIK